MLVIWRLMLAGILLDLVLITLGATNADSPLKMSGGVGYVVKAVVPLVAYGFAFLWVVVIGGLHENVALRLGTVFGMAGGVLGVTQMALENFGNRIGENSIITLAFMFGGFLVWGVGGYYAACRTGQLTDGIIAGCWGAMMSVLLAVTFGLILMTAKIPSAAYIATWQEFKDSGWTNARAFGIANSLDAVPGHLLIGPVVGIIFGLFGGGAAKLMVRRPLAVPRR